jgi:hypothetical protein
MGDCEMALKTCGSDRADERTRTAYPCSLRVMHQALQGLAGGCKYPFSKGIRLLCIAEGCTVLRSRWYQKQVDGTPPIPLQSRLETLAMG